MKKRNILLGLLIASSVFSLSSCTKKNDNKTEKTEETIKPTETKTVESTEIVKPTETKPVTPTTDDNPVTSSEAEVSYTMHVTNPKTGEIEDIVAKNGVVSGLEDCGNFTLTDGLFVTEYKHTGYTYNMGEEIKNGDIIDEDIYVYPTQEMISRTLNPTTEEKENVGWRIDEILAYFKDTYKKPTCYFLYDDASNINDYVYYNDGHYTPDKNNKFVKSAFTDSISLLNISLEEDLLVEYDKDGFYISKLINQETDEYQIYAVLDTKLNLKKIYPVSNLSLNVVASYGLKEITEEEFLKLYEEFEAPAIDRLKIEVSQQRYESTYGLYSDYVCSEFQIDENGNAHCLSDVFMVFDPYDAKAIVDEFNAFEEEISFFLGNDSLIISSSVYKYTFNLDGTIRSVEDIEEYESMDGDIYNLVTTQKFSYTYKDENEFENISFEEFFTAIYKDEKPKNITFHLVQGQSDETLKMALIGDDTEYTQYEGSKTFAHIYEVEATLYGYKGILNYIVANENLSNLVFKKSSNEYKVEFDSDTHYEITFNIFGDVTYYKLSINELEVYVNQTNEEIGYIKIVDPETQEETEYYGKIKDRIEIPSKSFGKMDGDTPYWYNPSYVIDEDGKSFLAGFVRPGRTTYTIHYDIGRCLLLEMYSSLDTSTPMDLVPFVRGTKFYDDNTKEYFFDVPSEKGYVVEGYYSDSSCTTPFDFTKAYTENTKIYAKLEAMTLSNYSIMGTGVVGDNYWFESITTDGSTDPVKTNLGCIEMTGTISAVRTENEIETNLTQRTTLEFDTASDGEMTITLGTDCLQVYYHVGYTAPSQELFNSGIVYRRMGTSFFQLSSPEGGADYYFRITPTKSVVSGKYQYTIPTTAEKVLLFFSNNTILYDLNIEYTE